MTLKDEIINEYFEWMCATVNAGEPTHAEISYRKLLMHLHNTEFIFSIPKDENRAGDGIGLRRRFALAMGDDTLAHYLTGPCSVLEMMIALAIRCEESIMDDPSVGDRTSQWFSGMIANLGLNGMTDARYDKRTVDDILVRFLNREYEPDGRGGLFRVKSYPRDLRTVEIWYQLCWYLDSVI